MKHLLKLMDLSTNEINEILNLADQLKYEKRNGIELDPEIFGSCSGGCDHCDHCDV